MFSACVVFKKGVVYNSFTVCLCTPPSLFSFLFVCFFASLYVRVRVWGVLTRLWAVSTAITNTFSSDDGLLMFKMSALQLNSVAVNFLFQLTFILDQYIDNP